MAVGRHHELSNGLVGKPSVFEALEIALRLLTHTPSCTVQPRA